MQRELTIDYDKLEAGRELDALVAEKVMGLTVCDGVSLGYTYVQDGKGERYFTPKLNSDGRWDIVLPYSTDIGAAWQMEQHVQQDPAWLQVYVVVLCEVLHVNSLQAEPLMCYGDLWQLIHAEPVERCRAALKSLRA